MPWKIARMAKRFNLKVNPKAKITKIVQDSESGFTVWTTAAPDKGQANDAVIRILADYLKIAKSKITIKHGAANRNKIIEIED